MECKIFRKELTQEHKKSWERYFLLLSLFGFRLFDLKLISQKHAQKKKKVVLIYLNVLKIEF